MPRIGVVADDLTGATTCAVLLARSGAKTAVLLNEKDARGNSFAFSADAVVISTNSRAMEKGDAGRAVTEAVSALRDMGTEFFSKRIDTTMRGGIGVETDAMMDVIGDDAVAVVVPAMPRSGRIMAGGYSIINGVPLSRTQASRDVRTPVNESYVPKLLSARTRRKVGLVELEAVIGGSKKIAEKMRELRAEGCEIIAADAVSEEDVEEIAKACISLKWNVLAVDPGAFTEKLALCRGLIETEKDASPDLAVAEGKCVLVAAGSATAVTRRQIGLFCREPGHVRISVSPKKLIDTDKTAEIEIKAAVGSALERLRNKDGARAIVFETAFSGELLDLDSEDKLRGYDRGRCADQINAGLGKIVKAVLDAERGRIAGLYCTGGDTEAAVCSALGVTCLEAVDFLIPQTDLTRIIGPYDGLLLVGKGGLTGDDGIVFKIADRLLAEAFPCGSGN